MFEDEVVMKAESGDPPAALKSREEEPVGEPFYLEKGIEDVIKDQITTSGENESGGFIVNVEGNEVVIPMENDLLKGGRPDRARYGYEVNSAEMTFLLKWMQAKGGRIIGVYHSHPGHEKAALSPADCKLFVNQKTGKPFLENAAQLVFATNKNHQVTDSAAYRWNPVTRGYSRAPLLTKQ